MSGHIDIPEWVSADPADKTATNAAETLVRRFCHDLTTNDADTLSDYFGTDGMYQNMPLPAALGRDAIHATLKGLFTLLRIEAIEVFHIASANDFVYTERVDVLTALSTGRTYPLPVLGVFQLGGDKIIAWRDYFDLRELEQAIELPLLSMMPATSEADGQ